MTTRKTLMGLSLICVLAFSAFGAASASAAGGTTAYTCDPSASTKDFEDAHCDTQKTVGGSFGHTSFAGSTEVTATNITTGTTRFSPILTGKISAIEIEITCEKAAATGSITNVAGPPMKVTGSGQVSFEVCKLLKPAAQTAKCSVSVNPTPSVSETINGTMQTKFSPKEGEEFTKIVIGDKAPETCAAGLKGTFPVKGTASAESTVSGKTWSGATLRFTEAQTTSSLTFAGNPAGLDLELTFSHENKAITSTTEP